MHLLSRFALRTVSTIATLSSNLSCQTPMLSLFPTTPISSDPHSWNIAISRCLKNHRNKEAMILFLKMRNNTILVRPDNFTYSIVLPCCDHLGLVYQVHCEMIKLCSVSDTCLWTNLMQMYASFGVFEDAKKVFDEMPVRDLVARNALLSRISKCGLSDDCFNLYKQLFEEGDFGDEYTYSIVLNALASQSQVVEAMQVHSNVIKLGFCSDEYICNSLLELYSKHSLVDSAMALLEELPHKDAFSWTTIVTGLSQSGNMDDAIFLFNKMQSSGVEPNSFTFGGLLSACAATNLLQRGKQLHALAMKHGFEDNLVVGAAISDMYFKCGEMEYALMMFKIMPEKDTVVWNGMICGYAQNGEARKALNVYDEMMLLSSSSASEISPNGVTFTGVLSACCHSGLVKEGCEYFSQMIHKHRIKPKIEHYNCMVDMLGRAGLLEEAEALMLQMPYKPDDVMWSTLLGACKMHRNLTMAMNISQNLHINGPWSSSNYVLLANSYANVGEWSETQEVREMMNLRGLKKSSGCSWIEIGGYLYPFLAGDDKSHSQIEREHHHALKSMCIHMHGIYEENNVLNFDANDD
ncbi:hypothetical protein HN51_023918 [Arachis hypogaea]|uniref:Pentatricopeptide repeat-containing protein n=2 Tax=Arachis hypogaea TaxID=3818 RepID=A0A445C414_ARAHY|nr:Pentatricopeptide repeat-containing protein [Arachis hypogaea]RYR45641.1 hypothetical protein Ahy_A07g031454 [Arachis hypogaea]